MGDVLLLSLDPGVTTGWALLRRRDKAVVGCGNLGVLDVGPCIDRLVRCSYRGGNKVEAVVERMPTPTGGELATQLDFVRRTIDHWLHEVFEVPTEYVLPGTWKTSRVAATIELPPVWDGTALTTHQKDAITMGQYVLRRTRPASTLVLSR